MKHLSSASISGRNDEVGSPDSARDLDLEARLRRTEDRVDKLLAQLDEVTGQKKALENVLSGIVDSKSWRLTAPLRGLVSFSRWIRPLYRNRTVRLSLGEGKGFSRTGEIISISGTSPYVELVTSENELPSGWVEITSDLSGKRDPTFFLLYYRTGTGYDQTHRIWLPVGPSTGAILARLPDGVRGLRLDPFETDVKLRGESVTVREIGKAQVAASVVAKQFRGVKGDPKALYVKLRKGFKLLREGGIAAFRARFFSDHFTHNYQEWVRKYDTLSSDDIAKIRRHIDTLEFKPKISIVMPTYNTPEKWLRAAIESVKKQLYSNWELCIADDCSTESHVQTILEEYTRSDSRIRYVRRNQNGHIAEASNSALALAGGEFMGLLDHDDELREHALYMVVEELNRNRDIDFLYSDEDKVTSYGMRFNPHFKSDWNPELFCGQMYTCHFSVFRTSVVRAVGGFRKGFDGAQDWDLAWRVVDASDESRIRHIPHVLYHWRVIEGSTAQSTSSKPYVMAAQKRSVEEHLARTGAAAAEVEILDSISQIKVHYPVPNPAPLVSIIIPTKDQVELLSRCVDGILHETDYPAVEIIIVDNRSSDPKTLAYFEGLRSDSRIKVITDTSPFNFSRLNNDAVKHSRGELVAFLNNDLEVIEGRWLRAMVSHAVRPGIGAVGARLLYPNGLLQHSGIILGIGGVAGHNHKGRMRHDTGYFNRAILTQNLSAVTAACMVVPRRVFDEVSGFDADQLSVAFNDVDLCLRIREKGYRIVFEPAAELYHHESASRGYETTPEKFARFEGEIEAMKSRWGSKLEVDPYYNPNLSLQTEDFAFAFPPRRDRPWDAF